MNAIRVALGFYFSIVVGTALLFMVVDVLLWSYLRNKWEKMRIAPKAKFIFLSTVLGVVERTILTGAFLLGEGTIVAAWLVLKVAGNWVGWKRAPGMYNVFLIGTGLSIIIAFVGACIGCGGIPPAFIGATCR